MSTATIAGTAVELNDEGFFVDPTSGPASIAVEMAAARRHRPRSPIGTGRSSTSCARSTSRRAPGPTVRVLGKTSGVSVKELYQLFPKGPAPAVNATVDAALSCP